MNSKTTPDRPASDRADDLGNRDFLVTGGTDGIGRATARRLVDRGGSVLIVGRTPSKGERVAERFNERNREGDADFLQADLSQMEEVRRLAGEVRDRAETLDGLVHCAGVIFRDRVMTREGLEASFAINYLSRFLLTDLLIDELAAGDSGTMVNVAYAGGNEVDALDFENLRAEKSYGAMAALNQAQVANDLFTLECAERVRDRGVGAACVNPGLVDTDIRRKEAPWPMVLMDYVSILFQRDPDEVARTPVRLAADAEPDTITGRFFGPEGDEIEVPEAFRDPDLRERLWRVSEQMADGDADSSSEPTDIAV